MIYLSGSINLVPQTELQREAELFARNGWELKDPTTHKVSITIAERDIEAFCQYLRNRSRDRKPKIWTDRHGQEHQEQTVTFYLNGSEMTGSWTRLRARLDPQSKPAASADGAGPGRQRQAPPVRRVSAPTQAQDLAPTAATAPPAPPAVASPAAQWNAQPILNSADEDDDDIPF